MPCQDVTPDGLASPGSMLLISVLHWFYPRHGTERRCEKYSFGFLKQQKPKTPSKGPLREGSHISVQHFQTHLLYDSVTPWPGEIVGRDGDAGGELTFLFFLFFSDISVEWTRSRGLRVQWGRWDRRRESWCLQEGGGKVIQFLCSETPGGRCCGESRMQYSTGS